MKPFRWGIFGTGVISANFVSGLAAAKNAEVKFIASRSKSRAQHFADGMGISTAIEGYAEAATSGLADAIYVATPPSLHTEHALLCIEAGVPVLIEKPMATSASEVTQITEAAKANSVFAMEAMWTRFLPAAQALKEKLASKDIGEIRMVSGSFGDSKLFDKSSKTFDPSMGGGALAQLGVYPLSLAQWLFGTPHQIRAIGSIGETGIDEDASFQLLYPGNIIGNFFSSIRAWGQNDFHVMGTHGKIGFHGPIARPYGLKISKHNPLGQSSLSFGWKTKVRQLSLTHTIAQLIGLSSHNQGKYHKFHYSGNGYHYQAEEVSSCIRKGAIQSDVMPLSDSIEVAKTVDRIRELIQDKDHSS